MMGLSMLDTWLAGTVAHASCTKHTDVTRQSYRVGYREDVQLVHQSMLIDGAAQRHPRQHSTGRLPR